MTNIMTGMKISKQDWTLFKEKLPGWQEEYMEKLLKEYIEYLESDEAPSTRFWGLEKKIKKDKNTPGVRVTLNKSGVDMELAKLIMDGVITEDDLDGFSDELVERVNQLITGMKDYYTEE